MSDDLISRQAAIDLIHKTIYGFFDIVDNESEEPISEKDKLLLEVNKAVSNGTKDLPSAERWIPVSERLPEKGNTAYMCTLDYGELGKATGQRFFYGKHIGWDDDAVVAWMPLPKPYKWGE